MGYMKDFKAFIIKKNVVDMAVSITVGAALGKIVTSIVTDILKPVISMVAGEITLGDSMLVLRRAANGRPVIVLMYGRLMQTVMDFFILAMAMFLVAQAIKRFRKTDEQGPA